jgi:tetratricopeptide (TPR) repeat protein
MADSPRIEELKRRVQMDPASIAFAVLAEEYRRAGQFEEAIATCAAGLRRHPAYLSAHVTHGRALAAVGRLDEARAALEYVLRFAPENLAAVRGLEEVRNGNGPVAAQVAAPAGETASPLVPDAQIPHHTVSLAPALGGLEEFLDAIARARTGRSLVR